MYLKSFDYFRAVAISFIVIGHSFSVSGWSPSTQWEYVLETFFAGGTVLFVFISGFLFHYIFYSRFQYRKFLSSKAKNVLVPYLLLSVVPIIVLLVKSDMFAAYNDGRGGGAVFEIFKTVFFYLWTGRFLTAYWYVPFIMIMFLLSPIFILYVRTSLLIKVATFLSLLFISMLVFRSPQNLNVIQSVVYFCPAYLLGILCSIYKDEFYTLSKNKEYMYFLVAAVLAFFQVYFHGVGGNLHKAPMVFSGFDLMLLHKLFLSLFFMSFLHRFETVDMAPLKYLATTSFAVFFLHPWVLTIWLKISGSHNSEFGLLLLPFVAMGVICICLFVAKIVKLIFGARSRSIIGW